MKFFLMFFIKFFVLFFCILGGKNESGLRSDESSQTVGFRKSSFVSEIHEKENNKC